MYLKIWSISFGERMRKVEKCERKGIKVKAKGKLIKRGK
jgi:hypothetical protein